jgi:hypothetical protein
MDPIYKTNPTRPKPSTSYYPFSLVLLPPTGSWYRCLPPPATAPHPATVGRAEYPTDGRAPCPHRRPRPILPHQRPRPIPAVLVAPSLSHHRRREAALSLLSRCRRREAAPPLLSYRRRRVGRPRPCCPHAAARWEAAPPLLSRRRLEVEALLLPAPPLGGRDLPHLLPPPDAAMASRRDSQGAAAGCLSHTAAPPMGHASTGSGVELAVVQPPTVRGERRSG